MRIHRQVLPAQKPRVVAQTLEPPMSFSHAVHLGCPAKEPQVVAPPSHYSDATPVW